MCKKTDKAQEANDSAPKKTVTMSDDVAVEDGPEEGHRNCQMPNLPRPLTLEEKKLLLAVERGDTSSVRKMLQKAHRHPDFMNMNCVDPLGRGALHMAIDNENLEMIELLVVMGIETRDALLHAIDVEFVEAVEVLLEHEEVIHKDGEPYSWERIDKNTAAFTPEITPLILAAHRDNYEILKILIDRGATLPMPHDIRCGCEECIKSSSEDSLRHSMARISAYRALASPSLIALSSTDPILTAFELSWELKNLAYAEHEFRAEYVELRRKCMAFAEELLTHTRSSTELAVILNHDPGSAVPYEDGEHMKLHRLEQAIDYKQKRFVAHPNIQQLLAAIWYEGLPGFRRKSPKEKLLEVVKNVALFPFYCFMYIVCPGSSHSKLMRKPFMKFLMHSASYLFFLLMLILVSVRFEELVVRLFGTESMIRWLEESMRRQRGNLPTPTECIVVIYVLGFLWEEIREMQREGLGKYLRNMWNLMDIMRDSLYMMTLFLRIYAYVSQRIEIASNPQVAFIPREDWDSFDAQLISEGMFAAANILSALKLVHIFSINPYLGPLQISLGRMVIDIVKFFFIYSLVLFAFACGLTQLLWYYNDLERQKCYSLPGGEADWSKNGDACMKWRRFANLFEASQSLFWAGFGMVGLGDFELTGIREYTRFWSMLMFGSYSVINIIVLLNLLIAMMSNSYSFIVEHADTEWKFARSKLWMSYFEEGNTLPPPFNLIPTPKFFLKLLGRNNNKGLARRLSSRTQSHRRRQRDYRYLAVMRAIIWRYVCSLQKRADERPVNEDDISEVKGDISSLRFELIDLFKHNGMDVSKCARNSKAALGRKMRIWERRLMRDFHVSPAMGSEDNLLTSSSSIDEPSKSASDKFRSLAKLAIANNKCEIANVVASTKKGMSQIGHTTSVDEDGQETLKMAMERARRKMEEGTPDGSPGSSRGCSPFPDIYTGPHLLDAIKSLELTPENSPSTSPLPASEKPWMKNKKDGQAVEPNMLTIPGRRSPSTLKKKDDPKAPSPVTNLFSTSNLKKLSETSKDDKKQDSNIPSVQVTSVSEVPKAEEKKQERAPTSAQAKTTAAAPKVIPASKITPASEVPPKSTPAGPKSTPAGPKSTPAGPKSTPAGPKSTPAGPKSTPAEPKSTPAGPKSNVSSAIPTKSSFPPKTSSAVNNNTQLPKEDAQAFKNGECVKPSQLKNGSAFKPTSGSSGDARPGAKAPEARGGIRIPPPQGPTGPRRRPETENDTFVRRPQPIQLSKTKESEELESMDFVRRPRPPPPRQDSVDLPDSRDGAKSEPPVIAVIPCTPAPPETPVPNITPPIVRRSQAPPPPKGSSSEDQKPSTPPAATFQSNTQVSASDPLISTDGGKSDNGSWL